MSDSMEIFREFNFEAAHRLPHVPEGHKCSRLHGHSYRFTIHVAGPLHENLGWVMDFGDIKKVVKPIVDDLDHYYLNDIAGLENPTSEGTSSVDLEQNSTEPPRDHSGYGARNMHLRVHIPGAKYLIRPTRD